MSGFECCSSVTNHVMTTWHVQIDMLKLSCCRMHYSEANLLTWCLLRRSGPSRIVIHQKHEFIATWCKLNKCFIKLIWRSLVFVVTWSAFAYIIIYGTLGAFIFCHSNEADSVVVPHILSLAAEVHGGPRFGCLMGWYTHRKHWKHWNRENIRCEHSSSNIPNLYIFLLVGLYTNCEFSKGSTWAYFWKHAVSQGLFPCLKHSCLTYRSI